jgi:hypothetical protein
LCAKQLGEKVDVNLIALKNKGLHGNAEVIYDDRRLAG